MSPKLIQKLESLGCTVAQSRYVVVEDETGERYGIDDDGRPRLNRDKDGQIRDTFCTLPKTRAVKVFIGESLMSIKDKLSRDEPDIRQEIKDAKPISISRD
jgi:hypothetical protein